MLRVAKSCVAVPCFLPDFPTNKHHFSRKMVLLFFRLETSEGLTGSDHCRLSRRGCELFRYSFRLAIEKRLIVAFRSAKGPFAKRTDALRIDLTKIPNDDW